MPAFPTDLLKPSLEQKHKMYDQFVETFRALPARQAWDASQPSAVFYYCSANALHGIARNKEVWATNLRFMNDASELSHGRSVAHASLENYKQSRFTKAFTGYLSSKYWVDNLFAFDAQYDMYAACFSEVDDDLSQWRAYGAGGRGYCLKMDAAGLRNSLTPDGRPTVMTSRRVLYSGSEQDGILDELFQAVDAASRKPPRAHWQYEAIARALRQALAEATPFFKHPAFAHEREWRLACSSVGGYGAPELRFREKEGRLFPFYGFAPRVGKPPATPHGTFPLLGVRMGALLEPRTERQAVQLLLDHQGFHVEIKESALPMA
ncbi:MAG: DUF2971 domain-containing protein [Thermoplasmatota archaeon]